MLFVIHRVAHCMATYPFDQHLCSFTSIRTAPPCLLAILRTFNQVLPSLCMRTVQSMWRVPTMPCILCSGTHLVSIALSIPGRFYSFLRTGGIRSRHMTINMGKALVSITSMNPITIVLATNAHILTCNSIDTTVI